MKRRLSIVALLGFVLIAISVSSAAADTQYQSATTAKLTMSSPEFEYVGQGRAWDFETPAFDVLTIGDPCQCFVGVRAQNFDTALPESFQWSFLYFQVPAEQVMTAGMTYSTRLAVSAGVRIWSRRHDHRSWLQPVGRRVHRARCRVRHER